MRTRSSVCALEIICNGFEDKRNDYALYIRYGQSRTYHISQSDNYWSSSTYQNPGNENNAWNVNFNNGNTDANDKGNGNYVRCVRELLYQILCFMRTITDEINTVETIFTLENLWVAYKSCIKRKKKTVNRLRFELLRERELINLRKELTTRTYRISRHISFVVTDPKPREIFAADFRDRVIHHIIYNELAPLCEGWFVPTSYANREGKGTHAGFKQVRAYARERPNDWYLKLDVESFFRSIDRPILFDVIAELINQQEKPEWWKGDMLWICEQVIFCDPTLDYIYRGDTALKALIPKHKSLFYSGGTGLPIGNLTSQFFANCYLDGLDKYISRTLGFPRYARYVDDFVFVDADKEKLKDAVVKIQEWLKTERKLNIHPQKIILQRVRHGIDFVGYIIKPTHVLVRRATVGRCKQRANALRSPCHERTREKLQAGISSYLGHFSHANSYRLRNRFKHFLKDPT